MRVYVLYLAVAFLSMYAYRNWFRSLCGLILLVAVLERPDMPKNILEIQGLNPFNLLLANVLVAWLLNRRRERLVWDMPRWINMLLLLFLLIVLVGLVRMITDPGREEFTLLEIISDDLINTIKWAIPGLLFFDGCRSRERLVPALVVILALYFLLAVQVIRVIPPGAAEGGTALTEKSRKLISNRIGYHPISVAMMLAGASWAVLAVLPIVRKRHYQVMVVGSFLIITYGLALTAGRMGYVTWGVVGLILCLLRWRRRLLLLPIIVLFVSMLAPGAVQRMLEGFGTSSATGKVVTDHEAVTSERSLIWPHAVDKIMKSPLAGYGRHGTILSGLTDYLARYVGESATVKHPHNAYLECAIDNGLFGLMIALALYGTMAVYSLALFRDRRNPWHAAVGGVASALVLALLVAGMGSQTLYPREDTVCLWAAFGLVMRLRVAASATSRARTLRLARPHAYLYPAAGIRSRPAAVYPMR